MEINAMSAVRKYAIHHYGNLISVSKPEFDAVNKTWIAEIKSDYPRIIRDDHSPNEKTIKLLSLRRLGTIKLKENLDIIDATPRDMCVEKIDYSLNMWHERAERIVIKASSDRLAHIDDARWVLGKIGTIISRLKLKNIILDREIDALSVKEATKLKQYLQLLESLEIVRHIDDGYSYGNTFTELSAQVNNDYHKLSSSILSHIIRERYSALREIFGISQLEPFVHVDSCYYRSALEADRLIYWNYNTFTDRYVLSYGNKPKMRFRLPYILDELVNVDALEYEDNCYFGNEKLFSRMQSLKYEMNELAAPRA